ncbi:hypothetical protein BPAE_0013g00920 [Botrytis paeoniae]|uniref:Ecp2 effector protein domain-containing protein n=1 Tax=Botrytis paeoniae TaxID=278948 RepID=A0A4Z1G3I4_9HELO|nr:hypothetical protein BPAE_0013g00920 [Botrytis paeoniae]
MKARILIRIISTMIIMTHSAIAYDESEHSLATPRMVVRCNTGEFINPEDIGSVLDGMSNLFQLKVGTPLISFNIGKNINRVVYTHNAAQLHASSWRNGKYHHIRNWEIAKAIVEINRICGGGYASIGRVWFPDWNITIGRGMAGKDVCKSENTWHTRFFG